MLRTLLFFAVILISSTASATSGRNWGPEVYTVDAMEINWRYRWASGWQGMNKVQMPKISFCQIIYWKWISHDPYKDVPRPNWKSEGYTMFEVKKDVRGSHIRELEDRQKKVTFPQKNHSDGYWYVTVRDNHHTIKIRSKILLGGIKGTDTMTDPEAEDRTIRNWDHRSPMKIHKEIIKFRQDAISARLARRQQEGGQEDLPDQEFQQQRQENLDSLEPTLVPADPSLPGLNHP